MSNLETLQRSMKRAILGDDDAADRAGEDIIGAGLEPRQRLQIHRNNYRETLVDSLKAIFPVTQAFVGEAFFYGAASKFVLESPPKWAQLSQYGEKLANFFDSYEHADTIPYVVDLLALEWAVHIVQNSREDATIGNEGIDGALRSHSLALVEQMQIIESNYPILSLWMVGTGQLPPEAVHLDQGGQIALVIGINGSVQLQALDQNQVDILEKIEANDMQELMHDNGRIKDIRELADRGVFTRAVN